MLTQTARQGRRGEIALFTGDGWVTKNEDEMAYDRLMAYDRQPDNSPAHRAFWQAVSVLEKLSGDDKRRMNESDFINKAIPDVASDQSGVRLLQGILDALKGLNITVNVP